MMSPAIKTGNPPSRRLPRAERRAAILDAATHAFAAGGFEATSMNDIADTAEVTPLILYRHFDGKDDLYRAVLERIRHELRTRGALRPSTRGAGPDVDAALAAARHDPDGFHLFWRHAAREPDYSAFVDTLRSEAVTTIREHLADSVPNRALLDWAARASVNYVIEAVLTWIEHGDAHYDERFVRATTQAMRAGVRSWYRP